MRKLVYSALAFSAALAVGFGVQATDASAATVKVAKQQGDKLTLESTNTGEGKVKSFLVGEAKVKNGQVVVTTWDSYPAKFVGSKNTAYVDLSKISSKKEAYLAFKADFESDDEAAYAVLPASNTIKGKYDKTSDTVTLTKTGKTSGNFSGDIIYRTESGKETVATANDSGVVGDKPATTTWSDDFACFKMSGAAVYFRIPAAEPTSIAASESIPGTTVTNAYKLVSRGSKEIKVTIGKMPNAPKVKVSYTKGIISIPKGAQYKRLIQNGDNIKADVDAGISASDKVDLKVVKGDSASAEFVDGQINGFAKFGLDVWMPRNDKKPESKKGHYAFSALDETVTDNVTSTVKSDKNGKVNVEIENKDTEKTYTVSYVKEGKTEETSAKLAPGKTLKLSAIKSGAQAVVIQTAGDEKTKKMAGARKDLVAATELVRRYAVIADKTAADLITKIEADKAVGTPNNVDDKIAVGDYVIAKEKAAVKITFSSALSIAPGYEVYVNGTKATESSEAAGDNDIKLNTSNNILTIGKSKVSGDLNITVKKKEVPAV